ncbi:MAG: endonuclease [Bacilli bacterium]|nr:endonuclease [Bacilli bacterium]
MKKIIAPIILSTLLFSTFVLINNQKEVKVGEAAAPANYYSSITTSMKGDTLKVALYNIIKGHTKRSYDNLENDMKITDRDYKLSPAGTDEEDPYMYLLYADYNGNTSTAKRWGTSLGGFNTDGDEVWNKEHIWAKSNGFNTKSLPAYSDLHHLRASDWKCNNIRSNNPFAVVATHSSSTAVDDWTQKRKTDNYSSGGVFEPRDSDKGDVARALFYMATRYYNGDGSGGTSLSLTNGTDSSGGKWGYLDTLLAWHEADPVDEFEAHRNDLVYSVQNNRNPYIDHPEYARSVFKNEPFVEPDTLTNLTYTGTPTKTVYKEGETFNSTGLTVTATFTKKDSSTYTTNVTEYISWSPSPLTKNTTSVTGSYSSGNVTKYIQVNGITVSALDSIRISGNPNKSIYEEGDTFVSTGLSVFATYGQEEIDVTSTAIWDETPLVKGQTSVNVTYGGLNATYTGILVKEKALATKSIVFTDSSSDGSSTLNVSTINGKMSSGSDIASVTSAANIFAGKTGLKFSSGSKSGSITITFKQATQVTKLVVSAKKYNTDSTTVTVSTNVTSSVTFTPTSDLAEYEITVNNTVSTFTISSPSGQRFYLKSIDVVSGSGGSTDSITEWGVSYLHIGDSSFDGPGTGLCKSTDLYKYAKVALFNLNASETDTITKLQSDSKYSAEYNRYLAWAHANNDHAPLEEDYSYAHNANNFTFEEHNYSFIAIIIIVTSITSCLFFSVLIIKKHKK